MRDRLVASFVGVTILAIVVFAVVQAYAVADLLREGEEIRTARTVSLLAEVVGEQVAAEGRVDASFLRPLLEKSEQVRYEAADGEVLTVRPRNDRVDADGPPDLSRTVEVPGGGTLTLSRSTTSVDQRVGAAVLWIVLVGLMLVCVAGLLGWLAARMLSRPFLQLAAVAGDFGRGRFDVSVPRSDIPEAEAIGDAMQQAHREVRELVRRERSFAVTASHQLKTPLTALRLELEDLTVWSQVSPEVRDQLCRGLREVDRLTTSIDEMLELTHSRRLRASSEIDLSAEAGEAVRRWLPCAREVKRELRFSAPKTLLVRLPAGPVSQVLDTLIDNAVVHGTGTITVTVSSVPTHLKVQVADQGTMRIGREMFRREEDFRGGDGRGIGLSVATEIAEALGGYLVQEPTGPTTLSMVIPRADPAGAASEEGAGRQAPPDGPAEATSAMQDGATAAHVPT